MNKTVSFLADICEKYRFEEKLLFVPSFSIGLQIREAMARAARPWINLKITTILAFCQELLALDLASAQLRLTGPEERACIVEHLCHAPGGTASPGCYFKSVSEIPGVFQCLSNTVFELRMAGIEPKDIDPGHFRVPTKGAELARILAAYQAYLAESKLIDHSDLLRFAIGKIKNSNPVKRAGLVLVLADLPVTKLERELIRSLAGEEAIPVGHVRPAGMKVPNRYFAPFDESSGEDDRADPESNQFRHIFCPDQAPPSLHARISMFRALGASNEVREVFRRILTGGIPLDSVEILVTRVDPYVPFIYEISEYLGLASTFATGIPLPYTRPGAAAVLYLQWLAEDFPAARLIQMLAGDYLDFEKFNCQGPSPSRSRAARIIRDAAVGWGRERYGNRLDLLVNSLSKKAGSCRRDGDSEKAARVEEMAAKAGWVKQMVEVILSIAPRPGDGEKIELDATYRGAGTFIERFARTVTDLDRAAKPKLMDVLQSMALVPSLKKTQADILAGAIDLVRGITFAHSSPKPAHLHVSHYGSGGYSARPHTYILGLDRMSFPGAMLQDPVLLDSERRRISPELTPATDLMQEEKYALAKTLSSITGEVTLSYSCRDITGDRELLPASALLGAYRLVSSNPSADYHALQDCLSQPVGFIPLPDSTPLDGIEWWLKKREAGFAAHSVHLAYPHLLEGENAEIQRRSKAFTEYDGWMPSAAGVQGPRTRDILFSCTRLEELAKCPFSFFLRRCLGVEPLVEQEKEVTRWLDALQQGELLHEVLRCFMQSLTERGERPNFEKHFRELTEIAGKELARWSQEIPPAGRFAYRREESNMEKALGIFLKDEEKRCQTREPCFFEVSFGIPGADTCSISSEHPLDIPAGTGHFKLRGRIDRIDRCDNGEYEVWDYKTGSSWGYVETGYLNRGRQLQHALYAKAAEFLLKEAGHTGAGVLRGGYFFLSSKGEGLRIEQSHANKEAEESLHAVLGYLLELLRQGTFPAAYDADLCRCCDYGSICGGEKAVANLKAKIGKKGEPGLDTRLDPWRRLMRHEQAQRR